MSLEPQYFLLLSGGIAIAVFIAGRMSRKADILQAKRQGESHLAMYSEACDKLREAAVRLQQLRSMHLEGEKRYAALQKFVDDTLIDWKKQGALLPSLREWSDRLQVEYDQIINRDIRYQGVSSRKIVERYKETREEAIRYKKEAERLRPQLALYESLAPWLADYCDLTVEEILAGIQEEKQLKDFYKSGDDPVTLFVPKTEWAILSETERNQLALDRYWKGSRRRSAWTAGIQYERYIGYRHEANGYRVEYHGAQFGLDDLGIDLVCIKNEEIRIIQCKRLSPSKGIPVRENIVAQVYGAAKYYSMEHSQLINAIPVIYTSYECSDAARKFAKLLGVKLFEHVAFQPYPCIKCNISHLNGQRIYHMPFDQQYDETVIGDNDGEFYAMTVAEAESAGFRRACRWAGKS